MLKLWRSWPAGMQLAVIGAVVFLVAAAGTWWVDDRSAFPEWLAAVATFAAFGAAALAARYAADVQRRESHRDQARVRDRRREQASQVAAWPGEMQPGWRKVDGLNEHDYNLVTGLSAMLRNASDVPVTDVRVEFIFVLLDNDANPVGSATIDTERIPYLEPGTEPQELWLSSVTDQAPIHVPDADEAARTEMRVAITFRDSSNRIWRRSELGVLAPA